MGIGINEIEGGMALRVEDQLFLVLDYSHVKPCKGSAFVRVRLKNMKTDLVIERTFRSNDTLDVADLEEKKAQYLYRTGDVFHFMDQESYEEIAIPKESLGGAINFLQDNLNVVAVYCDHKIQSVLLPNFMTVHIVETDPGFKGDSSRAGTKPAKVDTGATVQVPLFINQGDWIKIDTRSGDGQYVERVQK